MMREISTLCVSLMLLDKGLLQPTWPDLRQVCTRLVT